MQAKEIRPERDNATELPAGARLKPGAARHAIARVRQALARAGRGRPLSSPETDDAPDDEITEKVLIPKRFFSETDAGRGQE
jgi:hypothetical protein